MEKVRVGFIGVGGIATIHLKNIANNDHAEIIAVCDVVRETVESRAKEYQAKPYLDYQEMLNKEELDAVYVCVPPFVRGDIEEHVVEKGIHIFAEKPVELNLQTAVKKATLIKKSGVINASGYCLRYMDTVKIARDYLLDKKVAMVRGYYLSTFVEVPFWFRVKSKSGGQLVDQATHVLDLMIYLVGDIEKVNAMMALQTMDDVEGLDIPDVTSVNVSFKSGAVGQLASSIMQPDHQVGLELLGRDFRLELKGTTLTIIENKSTKIYESKVDFLIEETRAFIEAVRTNNQALVLSSYEEGVRTLAASLAANESQKVNETILISEFSEK